EVLAHPVVLRLHVLRRLDLTLDPDGVAIASDLDLLRIDAGDAGAHDPFLIGLVDVEWQEAFADDAEGLTAAATSGSAQRVIEEPIHCGVQRYQIADGRPT